MTKSRSEIVNNSDEWSLLDIPQEIIAQEFFKKIDGKKIKTIDKLSKSCSTLYKFFSPELEKQAAKQLLKYVLQGNLEKANKMYKANPKLIFVETAAKDYSRGISINGDVSRLIIASPYRGALGAGNIKILNDMIQYFEQVNDEKNKKNGYQLAAEQLLKQFPKGIDYPQCAYNFNFIANIISNDTELVDAENPNPNQQTKNMLIKFRKDMIINKIECGHHFNMNILLAACDVYNEMWEGFSSAQLILYWCQVIGYLQRLVSFPNSEDIYKGLDCSIKKLNNKNLVLSNACKNLSYFPLNIELNSLLGLEYGYDSYGLLTKNCIQAGRSHSRVPLLQNYMELTIAALKEHEMQIQKFLKCRMKKINNYGA